MVPTPAFDVAEAPHPCLVGLPDLESVAERLDGAPAARIVAWAAGWFGDGLTLAASFQDAVLIDLAVRVDPEIDVVFLDTGYHFEQTLQYVEQVRERYGLRLRVVRPEVGPGEWPCGSERCCELRKVEPLRRALRGKHAWMSGIRRSETETRRAAAVVQFDARQGLVKVNPLAAWTDDDVAAYVSDNQLLVHPLSEEGYGSIGCAPTTRPVSVTGDLRAGRWPGQAKTECGLHL